MGLTMPGIPRKVDSPEMFSKIAHRYDLLNHVLSLNIDRYWRKKLVRAADLSGSAKILDAATGTGDVAIAFARALPECHVVGVDRSEGMLAIGRGKIDRLDLAGRVRLRDADVLELPFDDGEFDVVSIAFGLRNLPDYEQGISEMVRVLRPGGKLLVLEFAPPASGLYLKAYKFYLQNVIPVIGGILSGSWKAYRYLATSIGDFLPGDRILDMMRHADLINVAASKMAGGVTYLFEGNTVTEGAPTQMRKKVLFVCYGNMIRSQMAEGFARDMGDAFLDVYSAGVNHTGVVSDEAIVVMDEKGIDINGQHSKGLRDIPIEEMDYIVSLTDKPARDMAPQGFTGETLDWNIEDPIGGPFNHFRVARDKIEARVKELVKIIWQKSGSSND